MDFYTWRSAPKEVDSCKFLFLTPHVGQKRPKRCPESKYWKLTRFYAIFLNFFSVTYQIKHEGNVLLLFTMLNNTFNHFSCGKFLPTHSLDRYSRHSFSSFDALVMPNLPIYLVSVRIHFIKLHDSRCVSICLCVGLLFWRNKIYDLDTENVWFCHNVHKESNSGLLRHSQTS